MEPVFRHVMRIKATDSPNVKLGLLQSKLGKPPSGERLYPGVVSWADYQFRLATWDDNRKTVGLLAEWYEGAELLLYPLPWLQRAALVEHYIRCKNYPAEAMGIDPGEGAANSAWAVVNRYGLKEMHSFKTPDTNQIIDKTLELIHQHHIPGEKVYLDRGSGKQHADRLRRMGYAVATVAFGESVALEPKRGLRLMAERKDNLEERYAYKNRRAYMYGELSIRLDPALERDGITPFAIPEINEPCYIELRRQLGAMPKMFDQEGRLILPPKNKNATAIETNIMTLTELLGCSPDEADALAIAYYALTHKPTRGHARAF